MPRKIDLDPQVLEILRLHPPIDLHADTPWLAARGYDILAPHHPPLPGAALGFHVDLPRLRRAGYSGQFFGLVGSPLAAGHRRVAAVERQIRAVEEAAARSGGALRVADAPGAFAAAAAARTVACAFGLEGAHLLDGRLDPLDRWAPRGLRYLTLAHFSRNPAASPRVGLGARPDTGLTPFGRALIAACEALRIRIDLAHASPNSFDAAVRAARAPVVVSHAGVASVRPLWRNLPDHAVRAVADTGGVVGVIFSRWFLGGSTADAAAAHLEALWRLGGEDLPALGSDFDGLIVPPADLRDPTGIGTLVSALLDRRVPPRVIGRILRENALRVFDRP